MYLTLTWLPRGQLQSPEELAQRLRRTDSSLSAQLEKIQPETLWHSFLKEVMRKSFSWNLGWQVWIWGGPLSFGSGQEVVPLEGREPFPER